MLFLSADSPLGLQTLISTDADASSSSSSRRGGGNVATRTIAASPSAVRCLANNNGGCEEEAGGLPIVKEEEERGGGGGSGGCWVSYGWRRLPRRLPPAIQSPRPLVRERTADGRLVISRDEEAAHRVSARKVRDRRLVLELVDDERNCGAAPPPQQRRRRWSHPLVGQEAAKASAASADGEESAPAPTTSSSSPVGAAAAGAAVPVPAPVPAEACFEGAIREASLREMRTTLLRMVH